jgi:hypothetical protein
MAASGPRTPIAVTTVDGEGTIRELVLPAEEVQQQADELAGAGSTVTLSFTAYPADDVASEPDPSKILTRALLVVFRRQECHFPYRLRSGTKRVVFLALGGPTLVDAPRPPRPTRLPSLGPFPPQH